HFCRSSEIKNNWAVAWRNSQFDTKRYFTNGNCWDFYYRAFQESWLSLG
ncbi:MAG: hypothetical protein ACJAUI_001190, partial [Pseudohongiellaceae bacterium]